MKLNKVIDIKNNSKVKSSVGYENWAKIQNLRTLADTHSFLVVNELDFEDVKVMLNKKQTALTEMQNQKETMTQHTARQKEIGILQKHLVAYVKNRKTFDTISDIKVMIKNDDKVMGDENEKL